MPAAGISLSDGSVRFVASNEVTIYVKPDPQLSARLFLQGAYDKALGLMRDDLRTRNLLPTQEPYSAMVDYRFPREEMAGIGMTDGSAVLSVTGLDAKAATT